MKILVGQRFYPLTLGRYMTMALQAMGHELWKIGPYSDTIPWRPELDYSKYDDRPDLILPDITDFPTDMALGACSFTPDLILNIDAVFGLQGHNSQGIPQAAIWTDPHCLQQRYHANAQSFDKIFVMQEHYLHDYESDVPRERLAWLPYAYAPQYHYPIPDGFDERAYDVGLLSALLYPGRVKCLAAIEAKGLKIKQESGVLFDEVAQWHGDVRIGLNFSSERDLPCRVWEYMGMALLCFTNRVPDLQILQYEYGLKEWEHYIGFDTPEECADKAEYYSLPEHFAEAEEIALNGFEWVVKGNHNWYERMSFVLDTMGLE